MIWASWSDFLSMGGYAAYVWGSYGVASGLIVVEIFLLRNGRRNALEQLGRRDTGGRE